MMKKSYLGSVVEFRLPNYFVYGVVVNESSSRGDTLVMYSPKYASPIGQVADLLQTPIRYNILFSTKLAASKKNADLLKIVGKFDLLQLPKVDRRFRLSLAMLSGNKRWHLIEGDNRKVIDVLTPDLALLSEAGIPNIDAIRHYYDSDYYPWSAALTSRGSVSFNPSEFESERRKALIQPS